MKKQTKREVQANTEKTHDKVEADIDSTASISSIQKDHEILSPSVESIKRVATSDDEEETPAKFQKPYFSNN